MLCAAQELRRSRSFGLLFATLALLVLGAGLWLTFRPESSRAPVGGDGAFVARGPTEFRDFFAVQPVVVKARIAKSLGSSTIILGQSPPLGEGQQVHTLELRVESFLLAVDEYLLGGGEATVQIHVAADVVDAGRGTFDDRSSRVFFLEPERAWGLGGFALRFGRESVLAESKSGYRFGSEQGELVPFLAGQDSAALRQAIAAQSKTP